jgi:hypothetical protein
MVHGSNKPRNHRSSGKRISWMLLIADSLDPGAPDPSVKLRQPGKLYPPKQGREFGIQAIK